MNLAFLPDGTGLCLHTDAFPLAELGTLKIERNAEVLFNNTTQLWEVTRPGERSHVLHSNTSHSAAVAWEIANLDPAKP